MCTSKLAITSVTKLQVPLKFDDSNSQGFKCPFFPSHSWRMKDLYVWNGDLVTNHIGVKKTPTKPLVTFKEFGVLLSNAIHAINGYLHFGFPTSHSLCLQPSFSWSNKLGFSRRADVPAQIHLPRKVLGGGGGELNVLQEREPPWPNPIERNMPTLKGNAY